ncbi:MAG: hypothetical protein Q4A15_06875, partial [Prevotellaceae bacterium]|nr:hypothetical protein [Prevotellaceae bacterium]
MGIKYDSDDFPIYKTEISSEEYRSLTDTNARTSILRTEIISVLREQLEKQKTNGSEYKSLYSIKNADISIERVCNIMGFLPTYEG